MIRPVRSESSLCAQWVAEHPSFLHVDSEDSDQTGRMLGAQSLCWFCHVAAQLMMFFYSADVGISAGPLLASLLYDITIVITLPLYISRKGLENIFVGGWS